MKTRTYPFWFAGFAVVSIGLVPTGCSSTVNDQIPTDQEESAPDEGATEPTTGPNDTVPEVPTQLANPFDINDIQRVTISPYGAVRHSRDAGIGHPGIDIPLPADAPFYAVADGIILSVEVGSGGRGGTDVMIAVENNQSVQIRHIPFDQFIRGNFPAFNQCL